jgi:hypothetical protein
VRPTSIPRPAVLFLAALAACSNPRPGHPGAATNTASSQDSVFAGVQSRGHVAMGVDQYTSTHHFEPLPDGGLITLERDTDDTTGSQQIRSHMGEIAGAFARGNFEVPGFVHGRDVPGTAVMKARRSRISYLPESLPRGAGLRIRSRDSIAVAAIHEFLAFQRRDHRSPDASHPR